MNIFKFNRSNLVKRILNVMTIRETRYYDMVCDTSVENISLKLIMTYCTFYLSSTSSYPSITIGTLTDNTTSTYLKFILGIFLTRILKITDLNTCLCSNKCGQVTDLQGLSYLVEDFNFFA